MKKSSRESAARCCSMEKKRLVDEIRMCDFCSESYEEFNRCYRSAARASGERSRSCIMD